jgi:hypothetical protein
LGVAVTVHDERLKERPSVLAALGIEGEMVDAQLSELGGPVADALTHQDSAARDAARLLWSAVSTDARRVDAPQRH